MLAIVQTHDCNKNYFLSVITIFINEAYKQSSELVCKNGYLFVLKYKSKEFNLILFPINQIKDILTYPH